MQTDSLNLRRRPLEGLFPELDQWMDIGSPVSADVLHLPRELLEPEKAAAGRPLPAVRLILGRVLWSLGIALGAASIIASIASDVLPYPGLALYGGIALTFALIRASDALEERSRRWNARDAAQRAHQAAVIGLRNETQGIAVRVAKSLADNDPSRRDEVAGRAASELRAIYRRRVPRIEEAATTYSQAAADLRIIQVPLPQLLRRLRS